MKKALLSMFSIILILLFILIFFSLYSRAIRHTEVCNALTLSMQQAMARLELDSGRPASQEEWLKTFVTSLSSQIQSQSELTIHVYAADMDKGLLSAEAILTYHNPIGSLSSVSTGKRTILLEELRLDESN